METDAKRIFVTQSSMPPIEEYIEEIKPLWESHWLTNMGIKHELFQKQLQKYLNISNVTLFTNGHLALENVIAAFGFPEGGEVITTPFTFASTTHAIVRNRLIPVFCDINKDTYTIDSNRIQELITDRTVAILPVHVYGHICDVENIDLIASKYGLKVIYDAAHAFGVFYKGLSSACFGDAAIYSFHATKVFNTIEGGAVCCNNNSLVQILEDQKNFGIRDEQTVAYVGGNAKMSEFQAAMGLCNLRHLEEEILKRKKVVECYRAKLSNVKGIKLPLQQKNVTSNYSYFPVVFDEFKYNRNQVFSALQEQGIMARKYFWPLTSEFDCYRNYHNIWKNRTPIAKEIASKVLTLPLYSNLDLCEVKNICDIILQ